MTFSQPTDTHVSWMSPKTLCRPRASITSCGAPVPAPMYGVSRPEEYHAARRPAVLGSTASSMARCVAITSAAASCAPSSSPASAISSKSISTVSGPGTSAVRQAAGET
mgnify:CR=1 FL=1